MPTEIIGKLGSLYLDLHCSSGSLIVDASFAVNYGDKPETVMHRIEVPFSVDDEDAINVIRKTDKTLKLSGRFDNGTDNRLVFFVKKAEEI